MLTDWETWTEPVFNAIRLQKKRLNSKLLLSEILQKNREKHQRLNTVWKKSYFNKTYDRKYKNKFMKEASNPQRASDTVVCN